MNENKVTSLDLGKYEVGNYFIEKIVERFDDVLQETIGNNGIAGLVKEVAKNKEYVPYIIIGDRNGISSIKYLFGTSMYFFFDSLETDEDNNLTEECSKAAETIIDVIWADILTLGDKEWYEGQMKLISEFAERVMNKPVE